MSLDRESSPREEGWWSSPGLVPYADRNGSPSGSQGTITNGNTVTWSAAKRKSAMVNEQSAFASRSGGLISRHLRSFSNSLPTFSRGGDYSYAEKDKPSRWLWTFREGTVMGRLRRLVDNIRWRWKLRYFLIVAMVFAYILFYLTPMHYWWRRASFLGGGKKFVIILAANQGGGVMEWKGPREWAIERDSVKNKRKYAAEWGYELEVVDMSTKKRYAHEWRESWEKVDTIRNCFRKYPQAEWFWWLDLNTFIMEPSYSLQSHIFRNLAGNTYRDINKYNPLNISHPFTAEYLDPESRSLEGDGKVSSINLIVPQDCGGFNLGSFFVKRSAWTDRLLDIWWDPVSYEQRHMEWEHKEQDALEALYRAHPWIRTHTAFIPQRMINSFPPGACGENGNDSRIHYDEQSRDFLVNMAGCEWGRDCWGEMYSYRELSNRLNRSWWAYFKEDFLIATWVKITGQNVQT